MEEALGAKYTLTEAIGQGGFGTVYRAERLTDGKVCRQR